MRVLWQSTRSSTHVCFLVFALYRYRFISHIIKCTERITMNIKTQSNSPKLVWAVMTNRHDGKSEVVKVVTDYHEADLAVQSNPTIFYKCGPVPIN